MEAPTPQLPPVVPPPVCSAPLPQPPGSVCQGSIWVINVTADDFIIRFGSTAPSAASAPSSNSSNSTGSQNSPTIVISIDSATQVVISGVLNLNNTQLTFGVSGSSSGQIRLDDCGSTVAGTIALVISSRISDQTTVNLVSTTTGCLTETLSDTVKIIRAGGANPACEAVSAQKVSRPTGISVLFTVDKSNCVVPSQTRSGPLSDLAAVDAQLNVAAVAGGAAGGAVLLLAAGILIVVIVRKRRQRALSREMQIAKNRIESMNKDPPPAKPRSFLHRLSTAFKFNAVSKPAAEVQLAPVPQTARGSFLPPVSQVDQSTILLHDANKATRRAAIVASPDLIQTYMPDSHELESTFAPPEAATSIPNENVRKRRAIAVMNTGDSWVVDEPEERIDYSAYDP
eukprot:TRINITY_DN14258_c0_g1_i1.p1 TRINITY_DN14258_c0_g1~~TRINITY_DN14258_c0_g1_i1.p1  ORF type:complete len:439 (+),score=64.36 TRINITY_DN14258_c0_g1_i1:121-1317(+)